MGASLTVFAYGGGMDARQLCLGEDLTIFKERQMDLIEVLGFLFMLSTMELGRVRVSLLSHTPPYSLALYHDRADRKHV